MIRFFDEKYTRGAFTTFLSDFLPEDFIEREEDVQINKDRYKQITKVKILGFCESLDLHVLEMDHERENDPRIAIATDAFKVLADHWIHKALVIFKNQSDNYRLSYLTITLDQNDRNKVIKKYSNARRYSFYLGGDAKTGTPKQQLIKKGRVKDADDLLSRFSVEVVNKQFYLEVAKFFDELVSVEKNNLILPGVSQEDQNIRKSFAVRLIGRIMFCWFLKQKKSDNGQLIPDELLSSDVVGVNYYHETIEPLFFGVLNTAIDARDIRSDLFDKVPYLNGGLFNPQSDDYYELDRGTFASKHLDSLTVDDSWFRGFFELLETYNFTIDENTVFDQELSVDPEMLGRIFENLLAEINPETGSSERKRTGSFYTPRQIVEYMVDQSLIEYLQTKTNIDRNKIESLVSYDLTDDIDFPLTNDEKELVVNAIDSLKLLDPACGSGAYPIGALQKIVYILQAVDPKCDLWLKLKLKNIPDLYKQKIINYFAENSSDYIRKLDVIKNSIFGVDIQPIAVDVSRLRCFLTLVVESEIKDDKINRGIEPLPNLDFKFVCANTLIGLPKVENTGGLFEDHSGIEELAGIMSEYFSCNSQRKNEIRLRFINTQKEILNRTLSQFGNITGELTLKLTLWDPFNNKSNSWFDPEWMFGLEGDFDIVIGNPPYIFSRNSKSKGLTKTDKDNFYKNFKLAKYQINLYSLFIEKGTNFLKEGGVLSFIVPNNWMTITSNKDLREYILGQSNIIIVNFYAKVFSSASVDSSIIIYTKSNVNHEVSLYEYDEYELLNLVKKTDSSYFLNKKDVVINITALKNSALGGLIEKIEAAGLELKFVANVKAGLKAYETGKGLPMQTEEMKKARVYHSHEQHDQTYLTYLSGRDVQRYALGWSGEYLKYGINLAAPRNFDLFTGPRILVRQIPSQPPYSINACYTDKVILNDLNSMNIVEIKESPLFVLGVLNSRLITFWFIHKFGKLQRGIFPQFKINELECFPIPKAKDEEKSKISDLVSKILNQKENNPDINNENIDREIDEMIYDLYGLNEDEKELIRKS
jgi:hypothetical protein